MTHVVLHLPEKKIELPFYHATQGKPVIDVQTLVKHGVFTYDPGFTSTASCESEITFIDGQKGALFYRGHAIDTLATQHCYEEVTYLLIHGHLPDSTTLSDWQEQLHLHATLPSAIHRTLQSCSPQAHPMTLLITLMGVLAHEAHYDVNDPASRHQACVTLIAQIPVLLAAIYRYTQQKPFIPPEPNMSYAANCLHMLFEMDPDNEALVKAFDAILTLHADHEQNASTSTVRMAGSTGTHPYAAYLAGICALWGPAHGGANEACLSMLETIGSVDKIDHYLARAQSKDDPFRLMGFGHRVYKNADPRANVMRTLYPAILEASGQSRDPIFQLAKHLEKTARESAYFIDRQLYPNIDFYSGTTLKALGFPKSFFTPVFVLGRSSGWMAHWLEMWKDGAPKISRPRQHYIGP